MRLRSTVPLTAFALLFLAPLLRGSSTSRPTRPSSRHFAATSGDFCRAWDHEHLLIDSPQSGISCTANRARPPRSSTQALQDRLWSSLRGPGTEVVGFTSRMAWSRYGGVRVISGSPLISDNVIRQNQAGQSFGLGRYLPRNSPATNILRNEIRDNQAEVEENLLWFRIRCHDPRQHHLRECGGGRRRSGRYCWRCRHRKPLLIERGEPRRRCHQYGWFTDRCSKQRVSEQLGRERAGWCDFDGQPNEPTR